MEKLLKFIALLLVIIVLVMILIAVFDTASENSFIGKIRKLWKTIKERYNLSDDFFKIGKNADKIIDDVNDYIENPDQYYEDVKKEFWEKAFAEGHIDACIWNQDTNAMGDWICAPGCQCEECKQQQIEDGSEDTWGNIKLMANSKGTQYRVYTLWGNKAISEATLTLGQFVDVVIDEKVYDLFLGSHPSISNLKALKKLTVEVGEIVKYDGKLFLKSNKNWYRLTGVKVDEIIGLW